VLYGWGRFLYRRPGAFTLPIAFGNFLNTVHAIRRSSRPPTTEQIQPKGEKLHVRRLVVKSRRKGRPLGRRPTTPNSLRRWSKMQTLAMRSTSQTIVNHGRITVGTDNHASFQRFHGSFAGCTRSAIRRRRFPPEPPSIARHVALKLRAMRAGRVLGDDCCGNRSSVPGKKRQCISIAVHYRV